MGADNTTLLTAILNHVRYAGASTPQQLSVRCSLRDLYGYKINPNSVRAICSRATRDGLLHKVSHECIECGHGRAAYEITVDGLSYLRSAAPHLFNPGGT